MVKCPFCDKSFNREETDYIHYKNRYWHVECYKEKFPDEEEKQLLIDYIKKLFNIEKLTPLIYKQIKDFVEEYKYTYSGMRGTLVYSYEIRKLDIGKARGIGIIPYNYEEAKNYFINIEEENKKILDMAEYIENRTNKENITVRIRNKNRIKKRRRIL